MSGYTVSLIALDTVQTPLANSTQLFLIDDDPSVNRAVSNLLESAGYRVTAFQSAEEFLRTARPGEADCLVLDLRLPGISGLALQETIQDDFAGLPVVFITGHGSVSESVQAMRQGAVNFLLKPFSDQALLNAVAEAVQRGQTRRCDEQTRQQAAERLQGLTQREREVMEWVVSGLRNRDIAERLGVTVQTVKVHRGKVMDKTGAASLCELVRLVDCAAGLLAGRSPAPTTLPDPVGAADRI